MKNLLLTLTLLLITVVSFSQSRVGKTYNEIFNEILQEYGVKNVTQDTLSIGVTKDKMAFVYFFNKEMVCVSTEVYISSTEIVDDYIKNLNKTCIKTSGNGVWLMGSVNGLSTVKLQQITDYSKGVIFKYVYYLFIFN